MLEDTAFDLSKPETVKPVSDSAVFRIQFVNLKPVLQNH